MRNCVAHGKSEAGLKIEFISALEPSCSKAACLFLGQWNVIVELTASKAAKRNQKHQTMNSGSSLQKKGDPYGLQRQRCPERPVPHNTLQSSNRPQKRPSSGPRPRLSPPHCSYTSSRPGFAPWARMLWACCSPVHRHPFQPWLSRAQHRFEIASSLKQHRPQSPFVF